MPDLYERSLIVHEQLRGKIGVVGKMPITSRDDLALAYTPGVARPCEVIAADPSKARELTIKRNCVAVVSDGSAVLGMGNIGPHAAIPVIQGLHCSRSDSVVVTGSPCLSVIIQFDPSKPGHSAFVPPGSRKSQDTFGPIHCREVNSSRDYERPVSCQLSAVSRRDLSGNRQIPNLSV